MTHRTASTLTRALLLGALTASSLSLPARAEYPDRPITFVVSFAAGGLSDVPGRIIAAEMQQRMGKTIIVENKPGASGVVGATQVWRAPPDGYMILVNAVADVQNRHYLSVPYDPIKDFTMIGKVTDGPPLVLIVNAALPYKSVNDIIADAKANPTKVSFATSGLATSPSIAVTQLNAAAGTKITEVPYRGTGPAAAAVVSGEVQAGFVFYSNAKALADGGQVRPVAIAGPKRIAEWPDVPTMDEIGLKGFDHSGFVGLVAPPKTPPEVIAYLNKHLNEALKSESFRKRIAPLGITAASGANTPEDFAAFLTKENARQAEMAKLSGHAPLEQGK